MEKSAPVRLLDRLKAKRLTLAVAESCTGGLIGAALTEVPGSSEVFLGGVIAYGDRMKTATLRIPEGLVRSHGAVSAEVAREMARGARDLAGADCAISATGIAGPGGGSALKPVGLVFVGAVCGAGKDERLKVRRLQLAGDREAIRRLSVEEALRLLEGLLDETEAMG